MSGVPRRLHEYRAIDKESALPHLVKRPSEPAVQLARAAQVSAARNSSCSHLAEQRVRRATVNARINRQTRIPQQPERPAACAPNRTAPDRMSAPGGSVSAKLRFI
jgi:hypothetical protein